MNDWNIQSRAHACSACEQPFVDQSAYHTVLFDDAAEGLQRRDVCATCWKSRTQQSFRERPGFISHWQGVYEAPLPPTEPIQKENAETLLRKLIELDDPRYIPAGYILAVMLERKRLLKVKEELRRDDRRVFVYEHSATGDVLTVVDPDLQLDQLEPVQREVALLLEHGLNPPSEAPGLEVKPEVSVAVPMEKSGATAGGAQPSEPGRSPWEN